MSLHVYALGKLWPLTSEADFLQRTFNDADARVRNVASRGDFSGPGTSHGRYHPVIDTKPNPESDNGVHSARLYLQLLQGTTPGVLTVDGAVQQYVAFHEETGLLFSSSGSTTIADLVTQNFHLTGTQAEFERLEMAEFDRVPYHPGYLHHLYDDIAEGLSLYGDEVIHSMLLRQQRAATDLEPYGAFLNALSSDVYRDQLDETEERPLVWARTFMFARAIMGGGDKDEALQTLVQHVFTESPLASLPMEEQLEKWQEVCEATLDPETAILALSFSPCANIPERPRLS